MIYAWHTGFRYYVPRECSDFMGNVSKQNDRHTITNGSTIEYNLISKKTSLGPNFLILQSDSNKNPYPGLSKNWEKRLNDISLLKGMNKDYSTFISSSRNGWNQIYNLNDQLQLLCEPGTFLETDGWTYFKNWDIWIEPALTKQTFPSLDMLYLQNIHHL